VASELGYPRRSTEEIEALADKLLQDYARHVQAPSITPPVPIEDIAEHYLGYSIELTNEGLFADPEMLGGIDFDNKVIFVNVSVEDHDGRYSFTVAHEIGHHVLHREAYLQQKTAEDVEILCRDAHEKPQIEIEADRFAAALLMPSNMIRSALLAVTPRPKVSSIGQARGLASRVIRASGFENVSNTAMINRLMDLGMISRTMGYQTGTYKRGTGRPTLLGLISKYLTRISR
jgi:Zn-dependent peptidase ImmA (M78 family)